MRVEKYGGRRKVSIEITINGSHTQGVQCISQNEFQELPASVCKLACVRKQPVTPQQQGSFYFLFRIDVDRQWQQAEISREEAEQLVLSYRLRRRVLIVTCAIPAACLLGKQSTASRPHHVTVLLARLHRHIAFGGSALPARGRAEEL